MPGILNKQEASHITRLLKIVPKASVARGGGGTRSRAKDTKTEAHCAADAFLSSLLHGGLKDSAKRSVPPGKKKSRIAQGGASTPT